PLYRGDRKDEIGLPVPTADRSIVRHILYLEGPGRETPYLSTSEQYDLAKHFAKDGAVWKTYVKKAGEHRVRHISKNELLSLMKGAGKGVGQSSSSYERMQARRYVEEWGEHLLDFHEVDDPATIIKSIFEKS
ncbi:hypothetical protein, partial [Komagataeibacter europaeus]|uniref:hypothetical protein n=1 Tax=Komagataeibacter europaeus TaxID=33995 RepID=UPI0018C8C3B6